MRTAALLTFCGLMAVFGLAAATPKKSPPDVFLVTIDTLRADHVHCYGYADIKTPALDGLANDGVRFAQAFTPSPLTNSSHTSILTGLLPSSHGVTDFAVPLADTHPTLAELLKAKGYHTAALIGAVVLDSKTLAPGLDRGFDFYDNFPANLQTKSHWDRLERRGEVVVQHAQAWLTAHPTGPHFVWVHLYDPHDPYEPPEPYSQTYKDRLYDGEIAYADSALTKFIAYLKAHGWYENSLVIAVGDHGEGLGQHQEETHGIFLYDATTHVPLIVKLPAGKVEGKVVEAQVRTTDILPTVLDVTGIGTPEHLQGKSLASYFDGGDTKDRTVFGETDYPLRFGWARLRSVRADGQKLIEAPRPELYDLHADPGEVKNIYAPESDSVKSLRTMLANLPSPTSSAVLPDPKDKIEQQNLLHKAMIAMQDKRPEEARGALEQVLQLDAKSSLALRQLGELELQTGEYSKAAQHLKRARETAPDDPAVAFLLGQALQKIKDLGGARSVLEESLKANPNEPMARLLLGNIYLDLKNSDAAADQFEAVLLVQPENVEGQLGVAKALIGKSDFAGAARALEDLTKSEPNNADVLELLAQSYRGLGKTAAAQQAEAKAKLLRKK
jgi:arylsulfatase A-like enzyme/cytochrome c-type biogenesis protein CcmH/NrfG